MKTWDVACRVILGVLAVIEVAFTAQRGLAGPEGSKGACCFDDGACHVLTEDHCIAEGGEWAGAGTTCDGVDCGGGSPPGAPCPWDFDGSGSVGASDLLSLLVSWGSCKGCPADFDGNGSVGASDLLALLVNWGTCP